MPNTPTLLAIAAVALLALAEPWTWARRLRERRQRRELAELRRIYGNGPYTIGPLDVARITERQEREESRMERDRR